VTSAPGATPRTVFLGSGSFAVETLRRLAVAPEITLIGVVTAPPRPAGRGGRLAPTPVAAAAAELGLEPVLTPERLRDPLAVATILALTPGLIVLADYGRLVPAGLLSLPLGALNLHPSLLPRHRGASPIPATILAGDDETGVTLMRMDAGLDTGPIVAQARMGLSGRETAPELEAILAVEAGSLLARSLGAWIRGELPAVPQPTEGATLTKPLRREDGRLDPSRPAAELERQVRAYQPWPRSFVETVAGRLTVWRASVGDLAETTPGGPAIGPGTLADGPPLRLATADGWLALDEVQPAGGRRMAGAEWLIGRPGAAGSAILDVPDDPGR
jgi:methionyl-tRNA formyltransferase